VSITDSQLHWNGSTGTHSRDIGPEYTAVWRLTTDDAQEQSQTVLLWFRANEVDLGDPYLYAGDTAGSVALAKRIRARRYKKSAFIWEVQVDYAPPDEDDGVDIEGVVEPDPLKWRPQLYYNTVQYQRPVERSQYLGGYNGTAATLLPIGHKCIPMNSAMVPFEPGLEMDDSRCTIRVVRNFATFDADVAEDFTDTVNVSGIAFLYLGFNMFAARRTAKIREWGAAIRIVNDIEFWEAEMVMDIDRSGWWEEVADRGFHARAIAGDPDGRGGSISGADIIPGIPKVRRLVDFDETPISTPLLLDGDGQPLDTATAPVTPVYGEWLHYEETQFKDLPQLAGIVF